MSLKLSNYYHPTPKKWRKLGDALLATATFVTTGGLLAFDQLQSIFSPHTIKVIIGVSFGVGVIGKFVTNLLKEPADAPEPQDDQKPTEENK